MSIKIDKKIIGYEIAKAQSTDTEPPATMTKSSTESTPYAGKVATMHDKVERPQMLVGSTYKIKTPVSQHAFYVTINDIILNPGTPYEKRRPFEMFINSKNMDHYQWISALTLVLSAVFRKGGEVNFLVEELQSVFDPKGGYFRKGGKFVPSLVAEIGDAIESHLKMIGLITVPRLDEHQQKMINQKRAELEQQALKPDHNPADNLADNEQPNFPPNAELCNKCHNKAMIVMDNCLTCLNCGESKCS